MSKRYTDFKETVDDKEVAFRVYEPTLTNQKEANKVRNEAFNDAIKSNAPLRSHLNIMLREQDGWDDKQEARFEDLTKKIAGGEMRIAEGGFGLDEAKKVALNIQKWRNDRRSLLVDMSKLDNNTAEGQADNMAFNYLVSACLVYNSNGKEVQYFKDLEDYLNRSTSDIAFNAANKLSSLMHEVGEDADKNLPENKFLLDFGFVDKELRFINEDGHLVDNEGRLVNEDGKFIDAEGNFIDIDGNSLTSDGEFDVEFKGFTKPDGSTVMGKSHEKVEEVKDKEEEAEESTEETTEEAVEEPVEKTEESS